MTLALVLLSVAVGLGAVAVARGQVRGGLEPATTSRPYRPLPEGAMTPHDVDAVRLTVALRGYRMEEVESVLDRLRDELAARDERIEALEATAGRSPEPGPTERAPEHDRADDGAEDRVEDGADDGADAPLAPAEGPEQQGAGS